jgi:uncharacterized protein (TIGR02391 family)
VNQENGHRVAAVKLAREISGDLAEFALPKQYKPVSTPRLAPQDELLNEYDRRILEPDIRAATRSRFVSQHYADAVEAGAKALNECVRVRTGRTEDGDDLMRIVFHPNGTLLRINKGKSKSDESAQRGHMLLCQGVVAAWRNPRAHALTDDEPLRALMMLELMGDLLKVTKAATRTRKHKKT